jgi:hypothetical protein
MTAREGRGIEGHRTDFPCRLRRVAGPGLRSAGGTRQLYAWDAENRLVAVVPLAPQAGDKRVEFAYDYLGRRVEKRVSTWNKYSNPPDWEVTLKRRFLWAGGGTGGWLMLMELDGLDDNAVLRKHTWGLDLAGQAGSLNSLESAGGIGGRKPPPGAGVFVV